MEAPTPTVHFEEPETTKETTDTVLSRAAWLIPCPGRGCMGCIGCSSVHTAQSMRRKVLPAVACEGFERLESQAAFLMASMTGYGEANPTPTHSRARSQTVRPETLLVCLTVVLTRCSVSSGC